MRFFILLFIRFVLAISTIEAALLLEIGTYTSASNLAPYQY